MQREDKPDMAEDKASTPTCVAAQDAAQGSTKRTETSEFVADGRERAKAAERPRIEREVRARYADRLARAGFGRRIWLRIKIRREIERKLAELLKKMAPHDALY